VKIGVSPTNIIYAGNTRKDKSGLEIWTKREDITDEAILAVVQFMYQKANDTGKCELVVDGYGKMTFERN
jgi:hypothetical protein